MTERTGLLTTHARYKLLLIDNNPEERTARRRSFERAPDTTYEIREEDLGEAGLATFQVFHPDCILVDSQLSDLSVAEFLGRLCRAEDQLPCAVVILTAPGAETA